MRTPDDYATLDAGVLPDALSPDNLLAAAVWGIVGAIAFAIVYPAAENLFWGRAP